VRWLISSTALRLLGFQVARNACHRFLLLRIADPEVDSLLEATKQRAGSAQRGLSTSLSAAQSMRRAINSNTADTRRGSGIYLSLEGLVAGSICPIPFSTASTARRADNQQSVLLDPVTCASRASGKAMIRDMCNFARTLHHAGPSILALLECKGILKAEEGGGAAARAGARPTFSAGLAFIFRLPVTYPHVENLQGRLLGGADRAHDSLLNGWKPLVERSLLAVWKE
jgi:hypothetical protein